MKNIPKVLPQSGDVVLVDATSNLDRQDTKFHRFLVPSPAGGLPIGYMITSGESEELLTEAMEAFRDKVLPSHAFFKRGAKRGPMLFITDDADAEINALR